MKHDKTVNLIAWVLFIAVLVFSGLMIYFGVFGAESQSEVSMIESEI